MGFFESLGTSIGNGIDTEKLAENIWAKVWPWVEPKLDALAEKYTPILMEKLMAMLPTLVAAAGKEAVDQLLAHFHLGGVVDPNFKTPDVATMTQGVIKNILDADPDIPGVSNYIDISEILRKMLPGESH